MTDPRLGAAVAVAVLALSFVGAGVYAVVPLVDDREDAAGEVVRDYVLAWGESRCDDAAGLIAGPRAEVLAACRADSARSLDELEVKRSTVDLDGDTGTAQLDVSFRAEGKEHTESVREELVLVDGRWKVVWRG